MTPPYGPSGPIQVRHAARPVARRIDIWRSGTQSPILVVRRDSSML
jgi:hypothetical protein